MTTDRRLRYYSGLSPMSQWALRRYLISRSTLQRAEREARADSLAALEACAEWIEKNAEPSDTGDGQQADAVLSIARAAIAKARRGS